MDKKSLMILVGLAVLLVASPAFAASTATARLGGMALDILFPVAGVFLLWLARKLVKVFEAKTGIDVPEKIEAQVDSWVEQGIALAEEKSRKVVVAGGEKLKGPEKLELAANFVLDLADQYKLKDKVAASVKDKVEAKLGINR